jgi:hypothetical protein
MAERFTETEIQELEHYIAESEQSNVENEPLSDNQRQSLQPSTIGTATQASIFRTLQNATAEYLDTQAWYFDSIGNVIYAPEESYLEVRAYTEKHNSKSSLILLIKKLSSVSMVNFTIACCLACNKKNLL